LSQPRIKTGFGSGQGFSSDPLQFSSPSTAVTEGVLGMQPNISTVLGCTNKTPFTVVLVQEGEIWQCECQLQSIVL